MREIIPANRTITIALLLGLLALIIYGAINHDPATVLIVVALALFFATPTALLYILNHRARRRDESNQP